ARGVRRGGRPCRHPRSRGRRSRAGAPGEIARLPAPRGERPRLRLGAHVHLAARDLVGLRQESGRRRGRAVARAGGNRRGRDRERSRRGNARGVRLRAERARYVVAVRMYTSLREIWWGFVKNAAAGAGGPWRALGGIVVVLLAVLPFFAAPFLRGLPLGLAL